MLICHTPILPAAWPLPNLENWSFEEIFAAERTRAEELERAGPPEALVRALTSAIAAALGSRDLLLGWEFSEKDFSLHRAVAQFPLDRAVFDWFFNARTGYRAHFRAHPQKGLNFNAVAVGALRDLLRQRLEPVLSLSVVDSGMNLHRKAQVNREDFIRSLDPALGKLWFGACPLGGGDVRLIGFHPRIWVDNTQWGAPYMADAWLDLKGAFEVDGKLHQPKSPMLRAQKLHETGEA